MLSAGGTAAAFVITVMGRSGVLTPEDPGQRRRDSNKPQPPQRPTPRRRAGQCPRQRIKPPVIHVWFPPPLDLDPRHACNGNHTFVMITGKALALPENGHVTILAPLIWSGRRPRSLFESWQSRAIPA